MRAATNEKEKTGRRGRRFEEKEEKRFLEFVACLHVLYVCVWIHFSKSGTESQFVDIKASQSLHTVQRSKAQEKQLQQRNRAAKRVERISGGL